MTSYRLGIDIGGTFTDIALLAQDGVLHSKKILSTPEDYSQAIEIGIRELLAASGIDPAQITEVAHGTTVATNTIIERKGVRVALVTTMGFRDVLEIARFRAPHLYDIGFKKPEPLVERRLRFEVKERIMASGEVWQKLDEHGLKTIAEICAAEKVDAVAICFINAYVNPLHEETAAEIFRRAQPQLPVTISSELLPQIQEYERTSTTVINAYLRPVIEHYVKRLQTRLDDIGIKVPLNIMQSNGGVLRGEQAAQKPMFIIESGPAAGVVGAQRLLDKLGSDNLIVFDMGGTTAKASVIVEGEFSMAPEAEVGGGAALGHRMVRGGGHVVQAPTIDIAEVGAGGGSIAWVDAGGGFQVGPQSAGANPGPVCYGHGGQEPTVTDANMLLGYLNPERLVGGDLRLDMAGARSSIQTLAKRLAQTETDTAYGIHLIANARMMRALSAVSSERGLEPARFPILAFGGNGGVHVTGLAESIGIARVVIPPSAGIFSALGLLFADSEHQCVRGYYRRLNGLDLTSFNEAFAALRTEAGTLLQADGYAAAAQALRFELELKYVGQNSALSIPVPVLPIEQDALPGLCESFAQMHQRTFGYRSDGESLQLVALRVIARGITDSPRVPPTVVSSADRDQPTTERDVYFGPEHGWRRTQISSRYALKDQCRQGPLIIEEYDSTTVVRPGWQTRLDDWNNIVLERSHAT